MNLLQKKITAYFEKQESIQIEDYRYFKLKMYLGHTEENRNGFFISEETYRKALPSLKNIPIVAHINSTLGDFTSHEIYENEDGIRVAGTEVVGLIPETNNAHFEVRDDLSTDGIPRNYLVAEGMVWTRNMELLQVLIDREGVITNSLEIALNDTELTDSGVTLVNDFTFEALCFLGEHVEEGMAGSTSFVTFSKENNENLDVKSSIDKALEAFNLSKGGLFNMADKEKDKKLDTATFEEGSESASDIGVTDNTSTATEADTEGAETAIQDDTVATDTVEDETETTVKEDAEVKETEVKAEENSEEITEEKVEEPTTEEGEDATKKEVLVQSTSTETEKEDEQGTESTENTEEKTEVQEEQEDTDSETVVKDLRKKKVELEQALSDKTVEFEANLAELEELRKYKFQRESEDIHKEFSMLLNSDVIDATFEANKEADIETIRTVLFAELGKKMVTTKDKASFAEDANELATFSISAKEPTKDDGTYGIFGRI